MIKLPKQNDKGYYLSYSQISLWKKSKRDYIRQYFFGEEQDNKQLQVYGDFGKRIGQALEYNDYSFFTEKEQEFLKTIPRYDEFEREIFLQMDGFTIHGYIDTNTVSYKGKGKNKKELVELIADYKTGEIHKRKSDYESDDYLQIPIYAAALQQQTGTIPKHCYVYLIQRDGNAFNGEELKLGEEFITIRKDITQEVIDKTLEEVQRIGEEISSYYNVYLKLKEL
jgi:hypothetical protein